ncbi:MAG: homoserine dehydrogenase [Acidimicrobiales bacterium]
MTDSPTRADSPIRVGILGCGTVGSSLVKLIRDEADAVRTRTGIELEVARVAVRNLSAERAIDLEPGVLTRDSAALVADPEVDIVVETIGGIEPARHLTLAALQAGKPVITANKELVANCSAELFEAANRSGVDLLFEAAVGGGIPLIRVLRESLVGERITTMMGIVNGTTNYILTKMTDEGAPYATALADAQQLGYAEADPTADVEGFDAGAKAAIMATVAFGVGVVPGDVYQEGISRITPTDIEAARRLDHVIKLLAIVERSGDAVSARVHPAIVPANHPLASVRDSFNAVFIQGQAVDDLMLYGRGAGGAPTASAMFGDLIEAAVNLRRGTHNELWGLEAAAVVPIDETSSAFYVPIDVVDAPGVLAAVATVFGRHEVSISSMEQHDEGDNAKLLLITHQAREADMQATVAELRTLEPVLKVGNLIRVIGS